jgi:glycosyltransferase involved in cell wall biosynthesis
MTASLQDGGAGAGRPLRIAYITQEDSSDAHAWSGSVHGVLRALRMTGAEVTPISQVPEPPFERYLTALKRLGYARLAKKTYLRANDIGLARGIGRNIDRAITGREFDVLFFCSSRPTPFVETETPVVFWTDATFDGMVDFYPEFSNLCAETRQGGHQLEQRALKRARLAIYSSDWAAATAHRHYDVDAAKVTMLRYGANIPESPNRAEMGAILERRDPGKVRLLLIGVDWVRKGGPKALAVTDELRRRGIEAELHVVGAKPEGMPAHVVCHGYVRKDSEADWRRFRTLYESSHFHIMPSVAECCAVVLSEAAAFGLPSMGSNVGGMTTALIDGRTGYAFDLDAPAADYADKMMPLLNSPADYAALCWRAFDTYGELLSWQASAGPLSALLRSVANSTRSRY